MKTSTEEKIINLLSTQLGVDSEDLGMDDSFREDLHMNAVEISDFASTLEENGFKISPEELTKLGTIAELLEFFTTDDDLT